MLFKLLNYLPLLLLFLGVIGGIGGGIAYFTMRKKLAPGPRGQLWFWSSTGFWSLLIGTFMICEKFFSK